MKSLNLKKENVLRKAMKWSLCTLVICFFSCKSDDDGIKPPPEDATHGFWLIADKGYILDINKKENILYNVSSAGCALVENDFDLEESVYDIEIVNSNELLGNSRLALSKLKFTRLPDLDDRCLPEQILNTKDPKVNFDYFWNFFNDHYAFFKLRGVHWADYKNLGSTVNEANFYDVLEDLVHLFKDRHVTIEDEEKDIYIAAGLPDLMERLNANLTGDLIIEEEDDFDLIIEQKSTIIAKEYLGGAFEADANDAMVWGTINNDIMYLNILEMDGFGTDISNELSSLNTAMDEVMRDIKMSGVSKLIIDIRFNGGGVDKVSSEIASRFTNQERVAFSKKARLGDGFTKDQVISLSPKGDFQFTQDIVLLTGPLTASSAEIFTLYLKDLPHVTIVGERTNGVLSDVLLHTLPNGASVGLSNEIYSDSKGKVYEGLGIGPDTENSVPFLSNDDIINKKDSGIERAIEVLNK